MNINASALNVNHHKKVQSNLLGNKAEKEKKNKLSTNVDNDKEKDKKRLRRSEAYKVELSNLRVKKSEKVESDNANALKGSKNDDIENFDTLSGKAIDASDPNRTKTAEEEFTDRLKKAIDMIKSGKQLSKKQEDWLNGELEALASTRYDFSKSLHLTREDKSILDTLGDNIRQRQEIFNNLLQEINSYEGQNGFSLGEINDFLEQKQMEDDLKILRESIKDKDEEADDEEVKDKDNVEEEDDFTNQAEEVEDEMKEDPLKDEKRAAEIIEKNIADIDGLKPQQEEEKLLSDISDAKIDSSYKELEEFLKSNDFSLDEKADALEEFNSESFGYAFKRESYRVKAEYDAETVMFARILLLQHDDLKEVIKKNPYKVPVIDQDTVINLLQR